MGTQRIGLRDIGHGPPPSGWRLLAPLHYLRIQHPEKTRYDFVVPSTISIVCWVAYMLINPKPPLFGDNGLLRFVRDLLVMGVPFMVGALAAVSMGAPGQHLDRRPKGTELFLDGRSLNLRAFMCYLLGYLSFLGLVTLGLAVFASLMHDSVAAWTATVPNAKNLIRSVGALAISVLLSFLTVTVFWGLYFLTDIVNRESDTGSGSTGPRP